MRCDRTEVIAFTDNQGAVRCPAEAVCLLQYRVEHWREVAGRRIDDLQYLGGRGLLLQCLAHLGDGPGILHCDDCLCREVMQQRNLLVGKWPHILAVTDDRAEQCDLLIREWPHLLPVGGNVAEQDLIFAKRHRE